MTAAFWTGLRRILHGSNSTRRRRARARWSRIENLEARVVLFVNTGNAWPNAQVVTISIVPDGTNLGGVYSNLNQAFNSNPALVNKWQGEILRAAQVWAQKTDINFVFVSDDGTSLGGGENQQGDSHFGDIRIGGYVMGGSTLALAYAPPPVNNFSIAGDIVFNTGVSFRINTGYDLFTVASHEIGHALGLDHTNASSQSIMWSAYNGVKQGLSTDDTAGIRNIYSSNNARSVDAYDVSGNDSFASAADLSSLFSPTQLTGVVSGLDITSTTDVDFFKFTAPTGANSTMQLAVQSTGLSLLAPKVTVYAADLTTVLGTATATQNGATLNIQVSGVSAGQTYYVKVQAANTSAFGVGQYALVVNMGTGANPTVPLPVTTLANGTTLSFGGGHALEADRYFATDPDFAAAPHITVNLFRNQISLNTTTTVSISATPNPSGRFDATFSGTAPAGSLVTVYDGSKALFTVKVNDDQTWTLKVTIAGGDHDLKSVPRDRHEQTMVTSDSVSVTLDA